MSTITRVRDLASYIELTPSLAERPFLFTLITTDFHPASPAAQRRPTFTNIDTLLTITPVSLESCKHDKTAVTQDLSGPPASPHCHLPPHRGPCLWSTRPHRCSARTSPSDTDETAVMRRCSNVHRQDCCAVLVVEMAASDDLLRQDQEWV